MKIHTNSYTYDTRSVHVIKLDKSSLNDLIQMTTHVTFYRYHNM